MTYPVLIKSITGKFVCCRAISPPHVNPLQTKPRLPGRLIREIGLIGLHCPHQLPRRQKRCGKRNASLQRSSMMSPNLEFWFPAEERKDILLPALTVCTRANPDPLSPARGSR